jgi:hypothetical protein
MQNLLQGCHAGLDEAAEVFKVHMAYIHIFLQKVD